MLHVRIGLEVRSNLRKVKECIHQNPHELYNKIKQDKDFKALIEK